ncbi:hypothetical protein C8F01DRAFT_1251456 [Mycena amicta]|nr:hypothetical protein C8F01DRAFT_1251456 [Mycena amicta]
MSLHRRIDLTSSRRRACAFISALLATSSPPAGNPIFLPNSLSSADDFRKAWVAKIRLPTQLDVLLNDTCDLRIHHSFRLATSTDYIPTSMKRIALHAFRSPFLSAFRFISEMNPDPDPDPHVHRMFYIHETANRHS